MQKIYPKPAEILRAVTALGEDANYCRKLMDSDRSQVSRRNWIRAYFAWNEVCAFCCGALSLRRGFRSESSDRQTSQSLLL